MRTHLPIRRARRSAESPPPSCCPGGGDLPLRHCEHDPTLRYLYLTESDRHLRSVALLRELLHRLPLAQA